MNTTSSTIEGSSGVCSQNLILAVHVTYRVVALKKNGQERNKLHLTLSLGGSEAGHNMEAPPVPTSSRTVAATIPEVPAEPMDESYMVMNSASVLSSLQSVSGKKPQNDA